MNKNLYSGKLIAVDGPNGAGKTTIIQELKKASREELYNWIKYRFMTDKKFSEFFEHRYFEKYIVNKIDKMIEMRNG